MVEPNELIAGFAKRGAQYGDCGRMCSGCAFKAGAIANGEEWNTERAASLLQRISFKGPHIGQFNCHKPGTYENQGNVCTGFKYALQGLYMKAYSDLMNQNQQANEEAL